MFLGAVPVALVRLRLIEAGGYVTTTRPEAHARPVREWLLRDRASAHAWLAEHPEPLHVADAENTRQPLLFT